ncbi:basic proline-rich protein-like [Melospiza melodia melodia]|uniref:basic proline-rich protein-like n=1 Tax=Melospiza melodia melodia TaxID=1914991 RepID=UPI002FD0FADF
MGTARDALAPGRRHDPLRLLEPLPQTAQSRPPPQLPGQLPPQSGAGPGRAKPGAAAPAGGVCPSVRPSAPAPAPLSPRPNRGSRPRYLPEGGPWGGGPEPPPGSRGSPASRRAGRGRHEPVVTRAGEELPGAGAASARSPGAGGPPRPPPLRAGGAARLGLGLGLTSAAQRCPAPLHPLSRGHRRAEGRPQPGAVREPPPSPGSGAHRGVPARRVPVRSAAPIVSSPGHGDPQRHPRSSPQGSRRPRSPGTVRVPGAAERPQHGHGRWLPHQPCQNPQSCAADSDAGSAHAALLPQPVRSGERQLTRVSAHPLPSGAASWEPRAGSVCVARPALSHGRQGGRQVQHLRCSPSRLQRLPQKLLNTQRVSAPTSGVLRVTALLLPLPN